jgi:hypothetical protein
MPKAAFGVSISCRRRTRSIECDRGSGHTQSKERRFAIVLAGLTLLTGCGLRLAHYTGYHGDGTFAPTLAPQAVCRDGYVVDLGAVDLTQPGALRRELIGLPSIEASLGLAMRRVASAAEPAELFAGHRPAARIRLTLVDERGRTVIGRQESLRDWIVRRTLDDADHAFLYQRGTEAEIAVAPGQVRVERFPIGPDESWGTSFTPRRQARYTLHFVVEEPDPLLRDLDVHLELRAYVACP